jgi:uncharacterized protein YlaN (UPF0358 family)
MTKYNYEAIDVSMRKALEVAQEDLDFLIQVEANADMIFTVERDISALHEALEVIEQYRKLEL